MCTDTVSLPSRLFVRNPIAAQRGADLQPCLGRGDFLAAVPADAVNFDKAALTMNHKARSGLRTGLAGPLALFLAKGAVDPLGAFEQEDLPAIVCRPGAGSRVAATDQ